ncbi:hypothetical protein GOODEAATRI_021061, partial [Goodea atripinnis]
SAHLAVIDALMTVGAIETVTAVKTCGSADLLDGAASWEDALLHWVNVLNQKLRERTEGAQNDSPQSAAEPQPVEPSLRYRKDKIPFKVKPIFPEVKEVKDLSSGCALAAVIHYYCPGLLRLEDVSMKDSMSAADSLYNLQFIREFCDSCLKGCCHLALEDMLYTPQELQLNFLSFLSELLYWLEVQKPEFVQPIDALGKCHSIPFGLDSDVDIVMGNPVITRSMSSDQLNPAGQNMNQKYTPPEDISHLVGKAPGPNGPQRASWASQTPVIPRLAEENGLETSETGELPTIEEALQIIHNEGKMEPRLHPDGAPDGFYLHSPDDSVSSRYDSNLAPISCSAPTRSGMMYQPKESMEPVRTRKTSGCSRDDDSVLRDGSVDSDALEDLPKAQSTPNTPAARANSVIGYIKDAPDSGVKMTNFAERKKRHNMDSPKASDPSSTQVTTWAQKSEDSPSKSPQLNNEMSELGARLEEKRKAIEAQKKRIEAIFAKHRQKLGERAFIQLKKEQYEVGSGEKGENGQVSASSTEEDLSCLALEEGLARMEEEKEQAHQRPFVAYDLSVGEGPVLIKEGSQFKEKAALPGPKSSGTPGEKMGAPLGDYNNAVSKLTAALSSLQTDMQRLSEQQNQLVKKKPAASTNKSWVIPANPKPSSPAPPRLSRESTRGLNVTSSSPSPSRKMTNHTAPPKSQVHRRA